MLGVVYFVACLPGTAWYVGRFPTDPSRRFSGSFTHGYSSHEGHRQDQGPMWECGLNLVMDEGCHNSLAKQLDLLIQRIVNNMGLSIKGL